MKTRIAEIILVLAVVAAQFLMVTGCGPDQKIDPELKVIMEHYLRFAPNSGKLEKVTSIHYGTVGAAERGVCNIEKAKIAGKPYDEERSIIIDPVPDGDMPVVLTVYHELGHCLHDLPHTHGSHDIMNSVRVGGDYWTPEHIDTSLQTMFLGLSY